VRAEKGEGWGTRTIAKGGARLEMEKGVGTGNKKRKDPSVLGDHRPKKVKK